VNFLNIKRRLPLAKDAEENKVQTAFPNFFYRKTAFLRLIPAVLCRRASCLSRGAPFSPMLQAFGDAVRCFGNAVQNVSYAVRVYYRVVRDFVTRCVI